MWYITYFKNTNKEKKKKEKKSSHVLHSLFRFLSSKRGEDFQREISVSFPNGASGSVPVVRRRVSADAVSSCLPINGDLLRRGRLLRSPRVSSSSSPPKFLSVSESTPSLSQFYFHWSIFTCIYRVSQNANGSEIKKAYYKLSLK
jgi:hypothetical protein